MWRDAPWSSRLVAKMPRGALQWRLAKWLAGDKNRRRVESVCTETHFRGLSTEERIAAWATMSYQGDGRFVVDTSIAGGSLASAIFDGLRAYFVAKPFISDIGHAVSVMRGHDGIQRIEDQETARELYGKHAEDFLRTMFKHHDNGAVPYRYADGHHAAVATWVRRHAKTAPTSKAPSIADVIATFPATFGLRGHPGVFRISEGDSYVTDGRVMLYTHREQPDGSWKAFAKGSPEELREQVVALPAAPKPTAARARRDAGFAAHFPANSYLRKFFAEKELDDRTFTVTAEDGTHHIMSNAVVVEAIAATSGEERRKIEATLREIDRRNGSVEDYLEHLGRGLASRHPSKPAAPKATPKAPTPLDEIWRTPYDKYVPEPIELYWDKTSASASAASEIEKARAWSRSQGHKTEWFVVGTGKKYKIDGRRMPTPDEKAKAHERAVMEAAAQGKHIPAAVLADYHELLKGWDYLMTPDEAADAFVDGSHPAIANKPVFLYGAMNRPPGYAVPKGYIEVRPTDPRAPHRTRHGVVVYDKPLSDKDVAAYELQPYHTPATVAEAVARELSRYAKEYVEAAEDDWRAFVSRVGQGMDTLGGYTTEDREAIAKRVLAVLKNRAGRLTNPKQRPGWSAPEFDDPGVSDAVVMRYGDDYLVRWYGTLAGPATRGEPYEAVGPRGVISDHDTLLDAQRAVERAVKRSS